MGHVAAGEEGEGDEGGGVWADVDGKVDEEEREVTEGEEEDEEREEEGGALAFDELVVCCFCEDDDDASLGAAEATEETMVLHCASRPGQETYPATQAWLTQ